MQVEAASVRKREKVCGCVGVCVGGAFLFEFSPNWIRNSVFNLRLLSFSFALLALRIESISSMKTMEGEFSAATSKRTLTNFSESPTHLEVSVLAETLKKVQVDSVAVALANIVFPFPGGPYSSSPRVGARRPLKMSGLVAGKMTISLSSCFAFSRPDTSSHDTPGLESKISRSIISRRSSPFFFAADPLAGVPPIAAETEFGLAALLFAMAPGFCF